MVPQHEIIKNNSQTLCRAHSVVQHETLSDNINTHQTHNIIFKPMTAHCVFAAVLLSLTLVN